MLEDSRQILVAANMQPDDPFPMDDKIKEGLTYFHTFFVLLYLDEPFSFAPSLLCHSHSDSVSTTSDYFVSCTLVTVFLSLILNPLLMPAGVSDIFSLLDISLFAAPLFWAFCQHQNVLLCLISSNEPACFSFLSPSISAAYSHVVENTAFFGDVALRFPRIVHHYYDRNSDWDGLLRWGLNFCNQTGVFTGGAHQHVLTLVRPDQLLILNWYVLQGPHKKNSSFERCLWKHCIRLAAAQNTTTECSCLNYAVGGFR